MNTIPYPVTFTFVTGEVEVAFLNLLKIRASYGQERPHCVLMARITIRTWTFQNREQYSVLLLERKTRMNIEKPSSQIVLASVILMTIVCQEIMAQDVPLTFKGKAAGGTLILGILHDYPRFVSIQTSAGESAESVAKRLADKITANHARTDCPQTEILWGGYGSKASGPTVKLGTFLIDFYIAGTETGLGIPEPPLFLTCVYDEERDIIRMSWENPPQGYDKIFVTLDWREHGSLHTVKRSIPGNATRFSANQEAIYNFKSVDVNDLFVAVVGLRDGIMSAPSAIYLKGHYQDESFAIPFARGIMTNWNSWGGEKGQGTKSLLKMNQRYKEIDYLPKEGFDTKPFYQAIKAEPSGPVGICRKFLGLTPGHTYRITAAMSTLQMHTLKSNWSFSLCAAYNEPEGKDFTSEQLTGKALLPNGKTGPKAGSIVSFGKGGEATGGGFRLWRSKSERDSIGEDGMDVTLPPGVDTITVWVRFECSDPNGEVGFMGAGIEDITAGQSKSKTGK
jgi:hypothetical protein